MPGPVHACCSVCTSQKLFKAAQFVRYEVKDDGGETFSGQAPVAEQVAGDAIRVEQETTGESGHSACELYTGPS